jgi:glyoxylase I family protein
MKKHISIAGIDHIYIAVSDMTRSEPFYDTVFLSVLGFRKNTFLIEGDGHTQYYNRHFGYVLRPARSPQRHDAYTPGLHHLCFRVVTIEDVHTVAKLLQDSGIEAAGPEHFPEYASDYWATWFTDPDNLRLEITNYREERRTRHDRWDELEE